MTHEATQNTRVKDQCFAWDKFTCNALNKKRCSGCKFFKSIDTQYDDLEKVMHRIARLDEDTFELVKHKYFPEHADKKKLNQLRRSL